MCDLLIFIFQLDLHGCSLPEDSIIADIRSDSTRHIVMATQEQGRLLADTRTWLRDATFIVVREPFYQHIVRTCLLAFRRLRRCRHREDYSAVLNALRNSLPCAPDAEEVVIDFESAMCQAVREHCLRSTCMGAIPMGRRRYIEGCVV